MSDLFKLNPNTKFDVETTELYRMREASDHEQSALRLLSYRDSRRRYLPIASTIKDESVIPKSFAFDLTSGYYVSALTALSLFAGMQFSKAYFPYGIILRSSIPQTWGTYFKHRAPIVALGFSVWYFTRYEIIKRFPDLTNDNGD